MRMQGSQQGGHAKPSQKEVYSTQHGAYLVGCDPDAEQEEKRQNMSSHHEAYKAITTMLVKQSFKAYLLITIQYLYQIPQHELKISERSSP